jgi:hypothetical protein
MSTDAPVNFMIVKSFMSALRYAPAMSAVANVPALVGVNND